MKIKYLVITPCSKKEFKDLGEATRHYSVMNRVFPDSKLFEQNYTAYKTYTRLMLG